MDAWLHTQDLGEMGWLVIVPVALILVMVLTGIFTDVHR